MTKPNLVIIHSFPANSKVLSGLYAFLSDHFTVYPIDLPGFDAHLAPIKDITMANYTEYVQAELEKLGLSSYILAGISFGFCVANNCVVDERCKGILALAPYLNSSYLAANPAWMRMLVAFTSRLGVHRRLYHSSFFQRYLDTQVPSGLLNLMNETIHPYTFFETTKMLLHYKKEPVFHDKPYVLVINEQDTTIQGSKTRKRFEEHDKVCIIHTTLDHHPEEISRAYFQKHFPENDLKQVLRFIEHHS